MFKKIVFISIFLFLLITFYTPSWAAAPVTVPVPSIAGDWTIAGTMKIGLNIKSSSKPYANISADLKDLASLSETFTFTDNGTFTDGFEYLAGTWTQNGKAFSVDLQIETLVTTLQETYPGVTAVQQKGSYLSGAIQKNGKIKGKFNTVINISGSSSTAASSSSGTDLTGSTMTISGSFTGSQTSNKSAFQMKAKSLGQTIKENLLNILQR